MDKAPKNNLYNVTFSRREGHFLVSVSFKFYFRAHTDADL
jgi:hypothetical protein